MIDQAIVNLLKLMVHDRLFYMADGPERTALNDAWKAVLSSFENRPATAPEASENSREHPDRKQDAAGKDRPAPHTDDPEQLRRAWDDAEATGLRWPGYDFKRCQELHDISYEDVKRALGQHDIS